MARGGRVRARRIPPWRRRKRWGLRLLGVFVLLPVLGSAAIVAPWRFVPPPTSAFMLRAAREGVAVRQAWTPLSHISPALPIAVVAAEDQKFPTHRGFDFGQIERAILEDRARSRGASTITQQVAKNLFLWPGRSLVRKALEAWFTGWLELLWPKRRILEVYLNVAEFGRGIYGADAASALHFGVMPGSLTPAQAALLAAVLPSPRRMSASEPSEYVTQRAREIQEIVVGLGGPAFLRGL